MYGQDDFYQAVQFSGQLLDHFYLTAIFLVNYLITFIWFLSGNIISGQLLDNFYLKTQFSGQTFQFCFWKKKKVIIISLQQNNSKKKKEEANILPYMYITVHNLTYPCHKNQHLSIHRITTAFWSVTVMCTENMQRLGEEKTITARI